MLPKAHILCSNFSLRSKLESILQDFCITTQIVPSFNELKNSSATAENSLVFIALADFHQSVKEWAVEHNPSRRLVIIINNKDEYDQANNSKFLAKKVGLLKRRGVVNAPFLSNQINSLIQLKYGEIIDTSHLYQPLVSVKVIKNRMKIKNLICGWLSLQVLSR